MYETLILLGCDLGVWGWQLQGLRLGKFLRKLDQLHGLILDDIGNTFICCKSFKGPQENTTYFF